MPPSKELKKLLEAIHGEDARTLTRLLRIDAYTARINERYKGQAPLHAAVLVLNEQKCLAMLRILLAAPGIDVNLRMTTTSLCALHAAVRHGKPAVVKMLLKAPGIYANATHDTGMAAIHMAADSSPACLDVMLAERQRLGINVRLRSQSGHTPLHFAAASSKPGCTALRALLRCEARADINARDALGRTPLHYAAQRGSGERVKVLLEDPTCAVDCADDKGHTALHVAASDKHSTEALRMLMTHDSLINARDASGYTPLHVATIIGYGTNVRTLLQAPGCNACATDLNGRTPLHDAAMVHPSVMDPLLAHAEVRACINAADAAGNTALHLAVACKQVQNACLLMDTPGCDAGATDGQGRTPLHRAATAPDKGETLLALLDRPAARAHINARDADGRTPLLAALGKAMSGDDVLEQVKALTACPGADLNAYDANGWAALHMAAEADATMRGGGGCVYLNALLAHAPERLDANAAPPPRGQTVLAACALANWGAAIPRTLLALPCVDPNRGCIADNTTPLHMAVARDNMVLALLLLTTEGVDVNASQAPYGYTPLHFACSNSRSLPAAAMVRAMIRHPRVDLDCVDHVDRLSPMQYLSHANFDLLWATKVCAACRREQEEDCPPERKLLMCACGLCYYCDAACQRRAWPRHSRVCPKGKT